MGRHGGGVIRIVEGLDAQASAETTFTHGKVEIVEIGGMKVVSFKVTANRGSYRLVCGRLRGEELAPTAASLEVITLTLPERRTVSGHYRRAPSDEADQHIHFW